MFWPLSSSTVRHLQQHLSPSTPCCKTEADLSLSLPVLASSHLLTHSFFLITSILLYPSSVQLLQDAQASEGQVVVLECRVRGSPPLQVRWYRQGEEILDSPDFRILQKSELFFSVVIKLILAELFSIFSIKLTTDICYNQNLSVCLPSYL